MARVNVETQALNDPRFRILGSHLSPLTKASQEMVETAFGLFIMVRVWNYCMEREILCVLERDLEALHSGLTNAMIDAQLGEFVPDSNPPSVRIKGGTGRLDWLKRARLNGKEFGPSGAKHGSKGGRPRKTPQGVSGKRGRGLRKNPPLTPSLALTPAPSLAPTPSPTRARKGKKAKDKDIAASPPVVDSNPGELSPNSSQPTTPQTRDELWDSIVSVTGADASIPSTASHIGRIRKVLSEAKPPYNPEDVLDLPEVAARQLPWSAGRVLTLGEIEKYIHLVRSAGKTVRVIANNNKPTLADRAGPALRAFIAKGASNDS